MVFYIFYGLFCSGLIGFAAGVIFTKTPIHSLLCLIMAFFNAAGLFLLWQAEFIAMLMVIVYVGAVAVLFLFVVMMLNLNVNELKEYSKKHLGFACLVTGILFVELIIAILPWKSWESAKDVISLPIPQNLSNTEAIGNLLYTEYFYAFQMAGIILLAAMIGAILLTLRPRKNTLKQNVQKQLQRNPENTLQLHYPKNNDGVKI